MAGGNLSAQTPADGAEAASLLGLDLENSGDLIRRIGLLASAIEGRIAFSTSLGIEDQAILHAVAGSGAPIDVFTLDTGRLFMETIDTIAESERRYGVKILRAPAGSTKGGGACRARRRARLPHLYRSAEGLLPCPESRAAETGA